MEKTGICRLRRIFKKYEICHFIGSEFSFWRTVQATTMIKYALAFTATANVTIMTSLPMIHTLNLKCFYWLMQKDVLRRSHMIGHPAVPHVASVYLLMGIKLEPVMLSVRRVLDQTNTVGGFWKNCNLIGWDDKKSASIWKPISVPKFPNDSNPQSSGQGNSNIEVFADYPITKREINSRKGLVLRQVFKLI